MNINYKTDAALTPEAFISLLERSGLAERRPVDDRACIEGMLKHADLTVTAWLDDCCIGVARSVTDFHYCCYLSDIAVDKQYQAMGIGKKLI
ncbi:MAG: GNAT family N-acetyltransferase, partial [Gammaproteobacteria bacterium]|nr:GNAT family N-acetyltransferase [Gammaproteobacteria bacterium]